jgi:hypothetical protein
VTIRDRAAVSWGTWSPEEAGAVKAVKKGYVRTNRWSRGGDDRSASACASALAVAAVGPVKVVVAWQGRVWLYDTVHDGKASRESML